MPRYYVETIEYSWCSRETLVVVESMGFCFLSVSLPGCQLDHRAFTLPISTQQPEEEKEMKWSVSRTFPQARDETDTHTLIVLYGTELGSVVQESWSVRQRASCMVAKQKTGSDSQSLPYTETAIRKRLDGGHYHGCKLMLKEKQLREEPKRIY